MKTNVMAVLLLLVCLSGSGTIAAHGRSGSPSETVHDVCACSARLMPPLSNLEAPASSQEPSTAGMIGGPGRNSSRERVPWKPPASIISARLLKPSVPKVLVSQFRVGRVPVVLERTLLGQVQKELGGTLGQAGDAGDSFGWLCVSGSDENGRWGLWLTTWELEGGTVSGFQWRHFPPNFTADRRCARLPKTARLKLPHGLSLGITETQVLQTLGAPSSRTKDTLLYVHEHHQTIHGGPFTVGETVAIRLRDGRASVIEVDKSTQG